jgi:hypothetical protein
MANVKTDAIPMRLHMVFQVTGGGIHEGEIFADVTEVPKFYPLTGHFMQEAAAWRVMQPVKILMMEYL